jgi:hypothetical protein
MPAAIGGSGSGSAIWPSATSARSALSGGSLQGVKVPLWRGVRLISARPSTVRQTRSGSSPMME